MNTLSQWQEQTNGTVIMVTHYLDHALSYADQMVIFKSNEDNSLGHIAYDITKSGKEWKKEEILSIKKHMEIKKNTEQKFPEMTDSHKKYYSHYIPFLNHVAYKNITSKADGSRSISLITFTAFLLLFFILFSGNQILSWFSIVDTLKNNTDYLRRFEISVQHPPGLSKDVRLVIEELKTGTIREWLQSKIIQDLENISDISYRQQFQSFEHFLCSHREDLCQLPLNHSLFKDRLNRNLLELMQKYSRYLTLNIQKNYLNTDFNLKKIKLAEQYLRGILRRTEYLKEMSDLPDEKNVAKVFHRYESGPEFIKKNGSRMNRSTRMRWLRHDDPYFKNPSFKYIVNPNFRFKSEQDVGIIIDKETLIDEMGYRLNDKEVKILYGTGEETCVPVRAVVERMPESNTYKILTTFGFGEKIRSSEYHCKENRKYTEIVLKIDSNNTNTFNINWNNFDNDKNFDKYHN